MIPPHEPVATGLPEDSPRSRHCPAGWPVAACCAPLLVGAVALVLVHKAGLTFLVLFLSSTALMVLLMAEGGHGLLSMTVQHGSKLRVPGSPLARPALRRRCGGDRPSDPARGRVRAEPAPYLNPR